MKEGYDKIHDELDDAKVALTEHVQRSEAWADTIRSTGTNPEQFGMMMQYAEDVNSGTRAGMERAYATMQEEMKILGRALGKEAPDFDPLDAHPDLKTEFDDGGLSRERALEIAASRADTNITTAANETATVTADRATAARQSALEGLTNVGNAIRDFDPHYESKKDKLIAITQKIVQTEADPKKWPAQIAAEYKNLPNPVATAPKPTVVNPIRPGGPGATGGNLQKEPGSVFEAVEGALSQL
jgi:hypothetical protein